MHNTETKLSKTLKYGSLLLFPLRDAFGFYLGTTPLRLGELWTVFYSLFILLSPKIRKKEAPIVAFLLMNLFLVFAGLFIGQGNFDQGFAMKYILRNVLNLFLICGFLCSSIAFSNQDVDRMMKYSFFVQLCAFVLLYGTHHYLYMSELLNWNNILASGQVINFGGVTIPRFLGTSSEPGYLAAFLPMLLYYFLRSNIKHRSFYISATCLMVVSTFSAAVYIATAFVFFTFSADTGLKKKYLLGVILAILGVSLIYLFSNDVQNMVNRMVFEKVVSMISGNKFDYSATERNLHIKNAIRVFESSDVIQTIFGRGTGGYLYNTLHFGSGLYSYDVEEAYNLYLSTLVDRGIIGLVLIIALFVILRNHVVRKDIFSESIFVGILLQFFHWTITGNLWQYYFWTEIVFLFGYYRWKLGQERNCTQYE
jgi:hypothetical protein